MPPKKVYVERGLGSGRRIQKGYIASTYETLTSPENSAMVKAIAAFGVSPRLPAHSTICESTLVFWTFTNKDRTGWCRIPREPIWRIPAATVSYAAPPRRFVRTHDS